MVSATHLSESDAKRYYADLNGMASIKVVQNTKNINEVNLVCTISGNSELKRPFVIYSIHKNVIHHIFSHTMVLMNLLDDYVVYLESKYKISSSEKLQYVIKGIDAVIDCIKKYDCVFLSFENVSQPSLIGNPVYV